ncbi:MAG: hypothetical protein AB3N15_16940 [Paracoccaceae bacterium]
MKYLHIPAAPTEREISEKDLLQVQGGTTPVCVGASVVVTIASLTVSFTTPDSP